MSVRNKAMFSMMLLILLISATFFSMLYRQNQENLQQMVENKTVAASLIADSILTQTRQQYELRIKSFINYKASKTREQIVKAFAERDREALLKLSEPFLDILKKENPYFASMGWILPDNRVFLRVHNPLNLAEDISVMRLDVTAVNQEHIPKSGFTPGPTGPQFRVVEPIFYQGEYLGALQMGIDARIVIETLQQKIKLPAGFSIANEKYKSGLMVKTDGLVCQTHTIHSTDNELFRGLIGDVDWDTTQQEVKFSGHRYILHKVLPLKDFRGDRLGCVFVAIDISDITAVATKSIIFTIFLSLLLLLLSYIILYFSFGSLVEKIVSLNRSLEKSNLELEHRVEERTRELIEETEERKKAEEKLHRAEKMEAIGLMASGIAHDLNNILSGIISYPELLLMRLPEDSKLRQPITAIKESGLRAAAVVADLLTVARDAAKVRVLADINTLVLEYLQSPEAESMQQLCPEVVIKTALDTNLPKFCCSPSHVNKCIMNLVMNATEAFSAAGSITISSSVITLPNSSMPEVSLLPGDYIVVTVEDNGPGISAEDLIHIFEPFYTKKKMGRSGTGIGLTVVWNCMEDHGGMVKAESDQQKGTVFTLLFPVGRGEDECHAGMSDRGTKVFQGNGETILVVDDEAHQRDIAVQILTELGCQAESVSSGESAIAYVKEHKVDLLLLDMMMEPGIDGCETFAEIVKIYPEQKAIIVSGYAESEQVKRTLDLGATSFLKKPYTMEQLGRVVGAVLYQSQ
ncbi:MAG: response regulator [Desulfuromusa sp.]|nr:response regulator [Desulfuromusa sp.]